MEKRGQVAMEFLMTYGWAIIIILIAVAALWLLGVFDFSSPTKCEIEPPFNCQDAFIHYGGVALELAITGGYEGTLNSVNVNGQACDYLFGEMEIKTGETSEVYCYTNGIEEGERVTVDFSATARRQNKFTQTVTGTVTGEASDAEVDEEDLGVTPLGGGDGFDVGEKVGEGLIGITLKQGSNMITLPGTPKTPMGSDYFFLVSQDIASVCSLPLGSQATDQPVCQDSPGDPAFMLEVGLGYLITANEDTSYFYEFEEFTQSVPLDLTLGLNWIGMPYFTRQDYSAFDILNENTDNPEIAQVGHIIPGGAAEIAFRNGGTNFNVDFEINQNEGYIFLATDATGWTPVAPV